MNLLHFGLQRSGTNFLENTLNKNYKVRFLNSNEDRSSPLQKHCRFYKNKKVIPEPQYENKIVVETFEQFESLFEIKPSYYLIISKDPYSWYVSYRSWAKKCTWPNVNHHYIEEYNLFYRTFIDFSHASEKLIFVRYIDLLTDPGNVLAMLAKKMKLEKRLFSKIILQNPRTVSQSTTFTVKKRTYYLAQEYLTEYNAEELHKLNALLDTEVCSFLGYDKVVHSIS